MDKMFETNSSFHVKYHPTRKIRFLFFSSFFGRIDKIFILGVRLGTRIQFNQVFIIFWYFHFPKILSLKRFSKLWGNSYIPHILLTIKLFFAFGVWKYYDHDCLQNLYCFLCLYYLLKLLKTVIFSLAFALSFQRMSYTKLENHLIPNLDLSEKIKKTVIKQNQF